MLLGSPPATAPPHLAAPVPAGRCSTRGGSCRPGRVTSPAPAVPPRWPPPPLCCWVPRPSPSATDPLQGDTGSVKGGSCRSRWQPGCGTGCSGWLLWVLLPPCLPAMARLGAARWPPRLQDKTPGIQSLPEHRGGRPCPRSRGWSHYPDAPCLSPCPLHPLEENPVKPPCPWVAAGGTPLAASPGQVPPSGTQGWRGGPWGAKGWWPSPGCHRLLCQPSPARARIGPTPLPAIHKPGRHRPPPHPCAPVG